MHAESKEKGAEGASCEIWVYLFESGSMHQLGEGVVPISATAQVDDFREAILRKFQETLAGREANSLVVKPSLDGEPLAPELNLRDARFELCAENLLQAYVYVAPKAKKPSSNYRAMFEDVLGHPVKPEVFSFLETYFLVRFKYLAKYGPREDAVALYDVALTQPGESTVAALRDREHLAIGAPFAVETESAAFFLANDTRSSAAKIVKFPTHKTWEKELKVCQDLKLDTMNLSDPENALTPVRVCRISKRHGLDIAVMVMPQFVATLVKPPKWIEPEGLVLGAKRIIRALNSIHQAGLVHMDVKGANIFVDQNGAWYLGDFGSCVPVDTPIISYTRMFYWKRFNLGDIPSESCEKAKFQYDWQMLAVALVVQLTANNAFRKLVPAASNRQSLMTKESGIEMVSEALLRRAIEGVEHLPLKTLLLQLMDYTKPQFD